MLTPDQLETKLMRCQHAAARGLCYASSVHLVTFDEHKEKGFVLVGNGISLSQQKENSGMKRNVINVMMGLLVAIAFSMAGCGGGGGETSSTTALPVTNPDPTAPSTPTGLIATQVNSDSITLNWNASTGGNGGVYSYKVFCNGQQVGGTTLVNSTTPILTTYTVTSLQPSTSYNFTVASTSLAGTTSAQSSSIAVTTASAASTVNKLLPHPYIVFNTSTGQIWSQCYISPGLIAYITLDSSHDLISHQRVDATLYKITTQGNRKYAVSDINTGTPIESSVDAPPLLGLGTGNGSMQKINMITGAITSTVSATRSGLLINIDDGGGAYLVGEAL